MDAPSALGDGEALFPPAPSTVAEEVEVEGAGEVSGEVSEGRPGLVGLEGVGGEAASGGGEERLAARSFSDIASVEGGAEVGGVLRGRSGAGTEARGPLTRVKAVVSEEPGGGGEEAWATGRASLPPLAPLAVGDPTLPPREPLADAPAGLVEPVGGGEEAMELGGIGAAVDGAGDRTLRGGGGGGPTGRSQVTSFVALFQ